MNSKNFPKLSIIIPVLNEEKNLARLLPSLSAQKYPRQRIEYIAIDDGSTDSTVTMLLKFGAKIYNSPSSFNHPVSYRTELNKGEGYMKSTGEFVYWMDADMELMDEDFYSNLIKPLLMNKNLSGSFTNEFSLDANPKISNSLLRFISYDSLQRDPVFKYFSPSVENTIIKSTLNYHVCHFSPEKTPPSGRIMYRKTHLEAAKAVQIPGFYDLDTLQIMVDKGFNEYAYVPKAKIRHYHFTSFDHLVRKRLRNLEGNFLSTLNQKRYVWFHTNTSQDLFKIITWIIYANLFIPELIKGLYQCYKYKDLCFLWSPILAIAITDSLALKLFTTRRGRQLIKRVVGLPG